MHSITNLYLLFCASFFGSLFVFVMTRRQLQLPSISIPSPSPCTLSFSFLILCVFLFILAFAHFVCPTGRGTFALFWVRGSSKFLQVEQIYVMPCPKTDHRFLTLCTTYNWRHSFCLSWVFVSTEIPWDTVEERAEPRECELQKLLYTHIVSWVERIRVPLKMIYATINLPYTPQYVNIGSYNLYPLLYTSL